MRSNLFIGSCVVTGLITGTAIADGHLWFGSEYEGEGNYYRFDVETCTVDLVARTLDATWVIDFKSSKSAVNHVATRAQLAAYASSIEGRGEKVSVAAWVIGDRQPARPEPVSEVDRLLLLNAVEAARP